MKSDWLLIDLPPNIIPEARPKPVATEPAIVGEKLVAVGFGPENELGERYQRSIECVVISVAAMINTNCQMTQGDSGGLLARVTDAGLEAVGIVSSGSRDGLTRFTPIGQVLTALDQ